MKSYQLARKSFISGGRTDKQHGDLINLTLLLEGKQAKMKEARSKARKNDE
jgi:hypothetical protein